MIREMPSVYSSSSSTTCLFNDKLGAVEGRGVDFGVDMIGSKRYGGRFGYSYVRKQVFLDVAYQDILILRWSKEQMNGTGFI